ncbi:hypothetical protein PG984_011660 [Apiospora sp. TS-2023a]
MADQPKKSENADPVELNDNKRLLLTMIDVCAGLDGDKWGDDKWAGIASSRGMSVPEAKRMFEEGKQKYLAERGGIPIIPRTEHRVDDSNNTGLSQQAGKKKDPNKEKDPKQGDA